MATEKNNKIPNFAEYEIKRIWSGVKGVYSTIFKPKRKQDMVSEKPKEQGTLKTAWDVFKETWTKTGKDFKKTLGFQMICSTLQGAAPYCQGFLITSLQGLTSGVQGAWIKAIGAGSLETIRRRFFSVYDFKGVMASDVLKDTHRNTTIGMAYGDILNKPRPYFKDNAPAALEGMVGKIASAKNMLLQNSLDCLSRAVVFGVSSVSLFAVKPELALVVLGATVVKAEFGSYMNNVFRERNSKLSSLGSKVMSDNADSIRNTPLVQDVNRIDAEAKKVRSSLDKLSKVTQKFNYARGKGNLMVSSAVFLAVDAGILVAAVADVLKTGDVGRFTLINLASYQMMYAGEQLSRLWNMMQKGTHTLIDTTKKLVTPKELERVIGKEKLSEHDTRISVQNVSFAYPLIKKVTDMSLVEVMDKEREICRTEGVLKDVSVTFDKGGLAAIVGTSGNGKSTLMSLIRHDYDVQEGNVYIGNKEIREISDEELNAQIAFVDQKVHFLDESIGYNLKYFKPDATEEELMEACRKAGFDADVEKFDDGLSHKIGQDGSKLSGGQQQRLALARTFLTDKPIVIMDEPTTGLDQQLSFRVIKALKDMAKDKTVIMVTHNPAEIALADRVVVVENGTITADGKPINLIQTSKFLRETLTKEDIINKRKLYNSSINGENPIKEVAELVGAEDKGYVLSDAERMKKRRLLEAHKRAFVGVRKNALKTERVKEGKPLPQEKKINATISVSKKQGREYA